MFNDFGEKVHFVGIGGIGMCGLARILIQAGHKVSGSDLKLNENTLALEKIGAKVFKGHDENQVSGVQSLVYSSAISVKNPERKIAKQNNIKEFGRGEALALISKKTRNVISILGAHGKTSSSAMLVEVFQKQFGNISYMVGGRLLKSQKTADYNPESNYFICESDESDGSFVKIAANFILLTNVDREHLDHYGSFENLKKQLSIYLRDRIKQGAILVANADCEHSFEICNSLGRENVYFFGQNQKAQFRGEGAESKGFFGRIRVKNELNKKEHELNIKVVGDYQLQNALGVFALAQVLKIDSKNSLGALKDFSGVAKRFELLQKYKNWCLVRDYAHHPKEIESVLASASKLDFNKIIAVFEPHRFSRTKEHWNEWAQAFKNASLIGISEIFSAAELPLKGVNGRSLAKKLSASGLKSAFFGAIENANTWLKSELDKNKEWPLLVIYLGAGEVGSEAMKMRREA